MIFHKGLNEIIAVIVAILAPQNQVLACFGTGSFQQLRLELYIEKLVVRTLVDKQSCLRRSLAEQFSGILVASFPPVAAEITLDKNDRAPPRLHVRDELGHVSLDHLPVGVPLPVEKNIR